MKEGVTLWLSAGNGPAECREGLVRLICRIRRESEHEHVSVDVKLNGDEESPKSACLILNGENAEGISDKWAGVIRWRSGSRGRGARKNWFLGVFRIDGEMRSESIRNLDIKDSDIRFSSFRAGGPGGQHQNTTDSAVRASWTSPDGEEYAVVSRSQRSQHQNKREAGDRLRALIVSDLTIAEAVMTRRQHELNHLVRGTPPHLTFTGAEL